MAGIDRQSTLRFLSEPADVNFGGKYTIIEIPLTAWPGNYVMIDRETGNSYTVPFEMLN